MDRKCQVFSFFRVQPVCFVASRLKFIPSPPMNSVFAFVSNLASSLE